MILVVGASGVVGSEVTRQLLGAGHRVWGTSRDPVKLTDLKSLGAEVVPADLIDRGSLDGACRGVEETTDQTFDVRELPSHSFRLTGVESFVRARIERRPASLVA